MATKVAVQTYIDKDTKTYLVNEAKKRRISLSLMFQHVIEDFVEQNIKNMLKEKEKPKYKVGTYGELTKNTVNNNANN